MIQDRYRLGAAIGEGGMGVVYRGHDEVRGADVAIKMVQSPDAPHILRWFLRGARLAQKITHPHVVETLDHGRLDDGAAFLVMELVEGINFDDVLHSTLPLPHKVHLLSQVYRLSPTSTHGESCIETSSRRTS